MHGVGGPTPESVLGCDDGGWAVPIWRADPTARSSLRTCPDRPDRLVYYWAPLTSGSRFFTLWPLLLPFTALNVAGWMVPDRAARPRRVGLAKVLVAVCGLTATVSLVIWLVVGWGALLFAPDRVPGVGWLPGSYGWTIRWVALFLGLVSSAVVIFVATHTSKGYERKTPPGVDDSTLSRRELRVTGDVPTLADPTFFADAGVHELWWRIHVAVAVLTGAGLAVLVATSDTVLRLVELLGDLTLVVLVVQLGLVALLAVLTAQRRVSSWRGSPSAAAALVAMMLVPGLFTAGLIGLIGLDDLPSGLLVMTFDAFGWSLVLGVGATAAAAVHCILRLPPAETPDGRLVLGSTEARVRAALAQVPGYANVIVSTMAVTYAVAAVVGLLLRWDERTTWVLTSSAPVTLARVSFLALIAFMGLNLVKSFRNPARLRRIGAIWDVLTFWPRTFHPFAVRPYAERAVPELQDYLLGPDRVPGTTVLAHSQGSVLLYAALLAHVDAVRDQHLRVVTFGSPLMSLYRMAFPGQVKPAGLAAVAGATDWTNCARLTDHIGRQLFDTEETLAFVDRDVLILDPPPDTNVIRGHNDYWDDDGVRAVIAPAGAGV